MNTNINLLHGCLIITVPAVLSREALEELRSDVLSFFPAGNIHGALFDMNLVRILDTPGFRAISSIGQTVRLLGAEPALLGLRPGVVSVMVDLLQEECETPAFRGMDDALAYLSRFSSTPADPVDVIPSAEEDAAVTSLDLEP